MWQTTMVTRSKNDLQMLGFNFSYVYGVSLKNKDCGWAGKILHQLIGGKHPIIYRASTIPNWWCRILQPSTECPLKLILFHDHLPWKHFRLHPQSWSKAKSSKKGDHLADSASLGFFLMLNLGGVYRNTWHIHQISKDLIIYNKNMIFIT